MGHIQSEVLCVVAVLYEKIEDDERIEEQYKYLDPGVCEHLSAQYVERTIR